MSTLPATATPATPSVAAHSRRTGRLAAAAIALTVAAATLVLAVPSPTNSDRPSPAGTDADIEIPGHAAVHDARPVRPKTASGTARAAADATVIPASVNVLALASRPDAERTIYLDFTGGTVPAGSLWSYAEPLPYEAYTADGDPAVPSNEVERTAIYQAWQSVTEDFAPFNVNVTTANPGLDALRRDNADDPRFGVHTIITITGNAVHQRTCGQTCGGIAVLDVMDMTTVQPVWVFSPTWQSGRGIGKTSSHEIGHALGLLHDGQTEPLAEYYTGSTLWGPIMGGAMASVPMALWSSGDYPNPTATQDDLAVIAESFPRLSDDHAGFESPTPIGVTGTGVIGDRIDTDAFTFTARGKVTISVGGTRGATNLDASLRLTRPDGTLVAYEDNPPASVWDVNRLPDYLPATWRGMVGDVPTAMVAVVDGVGVADPQAGYSDYGSLGAYTLTVRPGPSAPRWKKVQWSRSQRYQRWTGVMEVTGSEGPLSITRAGNKPPGVKVTVADDGRTVRFRGWPQRVGTYRMRLTATDAWGDATTRKVTFRVSESKRKHATDKGTKRGGKDRGKKGGR